MTSLHFWFPLEPFHQFIFQILLTIIKELNRNSFTYIRLIKNKENQFTVRLRHTLATKFGSHFWNGYSLSSINPMEQMIQLSYGFLLFLCSSAATNQNQFSQWSQGIKNLQTRMKTVFVKNKLLDDAFSWLSCFAGFSYFLAPNISFISC